MRSHPIGSAAVLVTSPMVLAGADYLNGGAAADRFRFSTALAAGNIDTIADFTHLTDDMLLSKAIFAGTVAAGTTLTFSDFFIA